MKILLAEDSPASRRVLRKTVAELGHECLAAQDGAEAWELFQSTRVDVVISNWVMPHMEGDEFCRRVRTSSNPYVYFIMLTASRARGT